MVQIVDIMRKSIAVIGPDAPLHEAAQLLLETGQRALPVVDGQGFPVGIISEGDFIHRTELGVPAPRGNWIEELIGMEEDTPARRRMSAMTVGTAMSHAPVCVSEDTSLDEVIATMDMRHIAQVLVLCGPVLVGLVGRREILEAMHRALVVGAAAAV